MADNTHPAPCLIVIFGASGDLTKRKLLPALYDLHAEGRMPAQFAVMGVSRSPLSDDDFRSRVEEFARKNSKGFDPQRWADFARRVHYHAADSTVLGDFAGIRQRMGQIASEHQIGQNVLYYLSMAPQLYDPTINNLGAAEMVTEGKAWCSLDRFNRPWQRIIVEKPFGHDPDSAAHLNRVLGRVFEEEDTYRIDHYLGKETVQNLMVFRFANTIFEPIWNRNYIDHVQVTAAESVAVEGRGGYYDSPSGGALRDMIQSHLLQVMAVVAMEPPVSMRDEAIRVQKVQTLSAVRIPREADVPDIAVRGQYGPGAIDGKSVPGYRESAGVNPESQTDTYAAVQFNIDTWRWHGVPFYLRSGKAMRKKITEVVITFKPTPHALFAEKADRGVVPPNQLIINVQPDEGIKLRFEGKVPGSANKIKTVRMDFDYVKEWQVHPPEAYATLLLDAMRGDKTLYKHRDEIESAWRVVQPVLDYWAANPQDDLPNYAAGTWGPSAADIMLARDNRRWHNPT